MQYAHVYNRGYEKRDIFIDEVDYLRFSRSLYLFNDSIQKEFRHSDFSDGSFPERKSPLVSIVAYCLMPNHFHLLIAFEEKTTLSQFIRKLSITYTKYFNIRYKRSGYLFQGRCQIKEISDEDSLLHVGAYIHANPFTAKIVSDPYQYRWSSLNGFMDLKADPIISHEPTEKIDQKSYDEYLAELTYDLQLRKSFEGLYED